jgi:hypothetical protein
MTVVYSTLKDISILSILFSVFIFIYVLVGMELYAYNLTKPEYKESTTSNFNTLLESFLTVFIIIANDGWASVYYAHSRSTNIYSGSIYFISLVVIG